MRKLALSGLVAVAAVLGSAIPSAAASAAPANPAPARAALGAADKAAAAAAGGFGPFGSRISCVSSTCLQVGANVNSAGNSTPTAQVLHGTTWKALGVQGPAGSVSAELTSVSCTTTSYCLATGDWVNKAGVDQTYSLTWNGSTLTPIVKAPLPHGDQLEAMGSVSCVAVKSCVVFGSAVSTTDLTGSLQLIWTWSGGRWGVKAVPGSNSTSLGLSAGHCFSLSSCLAVGLDVSASGADSEVLATWNGKSLTTKPISTSSTSATFPMDLSCTSPTRCAVVGMVAPLSASSTSAISTVAQVWNGSSWQSTKWTGPKGSTTALLLGVSCTSASYCVAVGAAGTSNTAAAASLVWNGTSWSTVYPPSVAKGLISMFSDVSCTATGHCVAFGAYGKATALNGTPLAGYFSGGKWTLVHA